MKSLIILRYLLALALAFPNLALFYLMFTPLTIYPSYLLINILFPATLQGNAIITQSGTIALIDSCIAGSAYYLLLMLNLFTPMGLKKRISGILFSFGSFLVVNIIRIVIFSLLFFSGFPYFNPIHLIFWYSVSTLLVVGIWIAEVSLLKIKEIPLFSDIKILLKK